MSGKRQKIDKKTKVGNNETMDDYGDRHAALYRVCRAVGSARMGADRQGVSGRSMIPDEAIAAFLAGYTFIGRWSTIHAWTLARRFQTRYPFATRSDMERMARRVDAMRRYHVQGRGHTWRPDLYTVTCLEYYDTQQATRLRLQRMAKEQERERNA